jgi:hypothetical protein
VVSKYSRKAQEFDLYAPTRGDAFICLVLAKDSGETYFIVNSRHSLVFSCDEVEPLF